MNARCRQHFLQQHDRAALVRVVSDQPENDDGDIIGSIAFHESSEHDRAMQSFVPIEEHVPRSVSPQSYTDTEGTRQPLDDRASEMIFSFCRQADLSQISLPDAHHEDEDDGDDDDEEEEIRCIKQMPTLKFSSAKLFEVERSVEETELCDVSLVSPRNNKRPSPFTQRAMSRASIEQGQDVAQYQSLSRSLAFSQDSDENLESHAAESWGSTGNAAGYRTQPAKKRRLSSSTPTHILWECSSANNDFNRVYDNRELLHYIFDQAGSRNCDGQER